MAKLVTRLDVIPGIIEESVADVVDQTAKFILTMIRVMAPVDTGALRDSYRIEQVTNWYVIIGSSLNYSVYQEFGTYKMGAQPHVAPSFYMGEKFLRDLLIKTIRSKLQ